MTEIIHIKCNGPDCKREIQLHIHANTWLKLTSYYTLVLSYSPEVNQRKEITNDFCSYYCLQKFINNQF